MMIKDAAGVIVSTISSRSLAEKYGYPPTRDGYIVCPFHAEKTPSLKLHKDGWYCYGCGAGGSVITFAMLHDRLTFRDAVKYLDAEFGLNLINDRPVSLHDDLSRGRRLADFAKVKDGLSDCWDDMQRMHEVRLSLWWHIYQNCYATPAERRTTKQWFDMENARKHCMYHEDMIAYAKMHKEEVMRWMLHTDRLQRN